MGFDSAAKHASFQVGHLRLIVASSHRRLRERIVRNLHVIVVLIDGLVVVNLLVWMRRVESHLVVLTD